jgi:Ca-activated chloride channel family protein
MRTRRAGSLSFAFAVLAYALTPTRATADESRGRGVSPAELLRRTDALLDGLGVATLPAGRASDGDDRTLAPFFQIARKDKGVEELPLEEATAEVNVAGAISHVRLRQVFRNRGAKPIEATYVFPASTRAAIHAMRMRIGRRTIEARIEKRAEAQAQYQTARDAGKRASLLEQQRPNVFTMRVANVMPRDRIEVELEYSELIIPEENVYEVVVPGVVGPGYPGGADPLRDRWMATAHLNEKEPEPWVFDVWVRLETGIAIKHLDSPSHRVHVTWRSEAVADVRLAEKGGGNRDFILRYQLAGEAIEAGALAWRSENGRGYFAVIVEPPATPPAAWIPPREYVFVVDVSGSMKGFPLETAKDLMRGLLTRLRPSDYVNVVVFSGASAHLAPRSLPATEQNIQVALQFVDSRGAGGGTELMQALETAYGVPRASPHVVRSIVLVTDGLVRVEARAFRFVRENLDSASLFAFGIGMGVNRGLIEGLARAGHGEPWVVTSAKEAPATADRFRRAIEEPVLTDIAIRYRGLEARDVVPMKLPDLLARRPLIVFGRFTGDATGVIEVSGVVGGRTWTRQLSVTTERDNDRLRALQWLWARKWIELLEDQHHLTHADEVEEAITDLGLAHRFVTPFTSFVAIDSEVANRRGQRTSVLQPLPLPDGVSNSAVVGGLAGGAVGGRLGGGAYGGTLGTGRGAGAYGSIAMEPRARAEDAARIIPGEARVNGGLSQVALEMIIRRHQNDLRYCYELALARSPKLAGKIVVHWVVDANGTVEKAAIAESSLNDADAEQCILARVRRWVFPAPIGPIVSTVSQSWVFDPADKGEQEQPSGKDRTPPK